MEPWRNPELGACACSQLRRASRAVSAYYDSVLAAAGLTVTQYALLVNIARAGSMTRSALGVRLGMDRTTVTRNLRPLERDGFLKELAGEDRRERMVALTAPGKRKLKKGFACWEKAQGAFRDELGEAALAKLRSALERAAAAARRVE